MARRIPFSGRIGKRASAGVAGGRTVGRSSGAQFTPTRTNQQLRSMLVPPTGRPIPGRQAAAAPSRRRYGRYAVGAGGVAAGGAILFGNKGSSGRSSLYGPPGQQGQYY